MNAASLQTEDVAQIETVRRACRPDFIIATDANKAGFSVASQAPGLGVTIRKDPYEAS